MPEVLTAFAIADPRNVENQALSVPDPASFVEIEAWYDTKNTIGFRVSCAHCGHRENHHRGFVCTLDDGQKALVGNNCGTKLFGAQNWAKAKSDFRLRQRCAAAMDFVSDFLLLAKTLHGGFERWKRAVHNLRGPCNTIQNGMPFVFGLCRESHPAVVLVLAQTHSIIKAIEDAETSIAAVASFKGEITPELAVRVQSLMGRAKFSLMRAESMWNAISPVCDEAPWRRVVSETNRLNPDSKATLSNNELTVVTYGETHRVKLPIGKFVHSGCSDKIAAWPMS